MQQQTTKHDVLNQYAERSNITVEELLGLGFNAYPCNCGAELCHGWQVTTEESYLRQCRLFDLPCILG